MADSIDLENLVKAVRLAKWLDVHVATVHRWLLSGRLKGLKIGRHWYVARADALALCQRPDPRAKPPRLELHQPKTSEWAHDVLKRFGLEK